MVCKTTGNSRTDQNILLYQFRHTCWAVKINKLYIDLVRSFFFFFFFIQATSSLHLPYIIMNSHGNFARQMLFGVFAQVGVLVYHIYRMLVTQDFTRLMLWLLFGCRCFSAYEKYVDSFIVLKTVHRLRAVFFFFSFSLTSPSLNFFSIVTRRDEACVWRADTNTPYIVYLYILVGARCS